MFAILSSIGCVNGESRDLVIDMQLCRSTLRKGSAFPWDGF